MKKFLKVLAIVLLSLILVVALFITGLKIAGHVRYDESFFNDAWKEFSIPGIHDGYVPQGITYDEASGNFLCCGYMDDGSTSRVYVVDPKTDENRYVLLRNADESNCTGHVGGLAVYAEYLYVVDDGHTLVYLLSDVLNAEEGAFVTARGIVPSNCRASFNYVKDDILYVGEFYRAENYETDSTHHFTTETGEVNRALIFAYELDEDAEFGVVSDSPLYAYSITDQIQGMCITDKGDICLSASWGPATSYLYLYEGVPTDEGDATVTVRGTEVPVIFLDSSDLKETIELAPMSEEVTYVNGRIYTMYESASNKYIFGKFFRETHSWSIARE